MVQERPDEPNRGHEAEENDDCPICRHEFGMPWEQIPETTLTEKLIADGFTLSPDSELDDAALWKKLHAIIDRLAEWGTYLHSTDHLSDRELYRKLIEEILPEPTKDFESIQPPGETDGWQHHIDLAGTGSDEDIQIYLRYYCDDEVRERWRRELPGMEIPPKEKRPYDRDRFLPGGEGHKG
ncbi:MAG: hypothetical protein RL885_10565 [Planctomycetota bacterium]